MTVTSAQVTTLLENVLFESATLAKANATQVTAYANLSSSTSTVAGLSAFLATQPEATIAEQVVRYYQGALGRVPAPVEIAYYVAIAEQGLSSAQIAEGTTAVSGSTWATIASYFAASPEFKADFGLTGATTNEAIVITGFYHNILGRAPSAAELTYYEGLVNSGTSYATLIQYFTESPEYQALANTGIQSELAAAGTTAVATVAAGGTPLTSTTPIGTLPTAPGSSFSYSTNGSAAVGATTFIAGLTITGSASSTQNTLTLNDLAASGSDTISLPAGTTISNIQLLDVNGSSTDAVVLNTSASGWASLTNVTVNSGGAQTITASSSQAVTATTTANGEVLINGGSTVTTTSTATDGGSTLLLSAVVVGDVSYGGSTGTAPTGAVSVTRTQTVSAANSAPGDIIVIGGVGVTVTSTVNAGLTLGANNSGTQTADDAGLINVAPTSGAVVINSATNLTAANLTVVGSAIEVTGGSSVTVNETVSETATIATPSGFTGGAVTVTGDSTTTTVSVTQAAVATGVGYAAAVAAVGTTNGVTSETAGAGLTGATSVTEANAAQGSAAVTQSTAAVSADGAVTIADKNGTSATAANTLATVTLANYGNSSITSSALTAVTLSGTAGTLTIVNDNTAAQTAAASTLTLNVSGLKDTGAGGTSDAITDTHGEIATLNIVTGASNSAIVGGPLLSTTAITDAGLTTLNVSGSSVLTLGAFSAAPTTIKVTGAAGFTGVITDTATTFSAAGSTGVDTIGIGAVPTKAITGSSATTNELVVNAPGVADTTATTAHLTALSTEVTGFSVLGVNSAVTSDTFDMSKLSSSFTSIDVDNTAAWGTGATTVSFTNVVTGTKLSIDGTGDTVSYKLADTTGASDSVTLTLAGGSGGLAAATVTLEDANSIGVGTVNIISNASTFSTGTNHLTLTDTGVTALSVSGTGALAIAAYSDSATSLAVTNTDTNTPASVAAATAVTGQVTFASITDASLGNLTNAGTGTTVVTSLVDSAANITFGNTSTGELEVTAITGGAGAYHLTFTGTGAIDIGTLATSNATITLTNSGTGTVTVGDLTTITDAALTTVNLSGNVAFGTDTSTANPLVTLTTGTTLSASTDNAHINFSTGVTASGATDTLTVGNGNDFITDASTAGAVNVTVGTGYNLIDISAGSAATYSATVTLGTHTSTSSLFDEIKTGVVTATVVLPNTVITGASAGDVLFVHDASITAVANASSSQETAITAQTSLGNAINTAAADAGAHTAIVFQYGGNTYVYENSTAGAVVATHAGDTLVELVGLHTVSTTLVSTQGIVLAS